MALRFIYSRRCSGQRPGTVTIMTKILVLLLPINLLIVIGITYYLDENGNKVIGPKEINGVWYYFNQYGEQVKDRVSLMTVITRNVVA